MKWTFVHLPLPSIAHILPAVQNSYNHSKTFETVYQIKQFWVFDAWICLAQKMQIPNQSANGSLWHCDHAYCNTSPLCHRTQAMEMTVTWAIRVIELNRRLSDCQEILHVPHSGVGTSIQNRTSQAKQLKPKLLPLLQSCASIETFTLDDCD